MELSPVQNQSVRLILSALREKDYFTALLLTRKLANNQVVFEPTLPIINAANFTIEDIIYLEKQTKANLRLHRYSAAVCYLEMIRRIVKRENEIAHKSL